MFGFGTEGVFLWMAVGGWEVLVDHSTPTSLHLDFPYIPQNAPLFPSHLLPMSVLSSNTAWGAEKEHGVEKSAKLNSLAVHVASSRPQFPPFLLCLLSCTPCCCLGPPSSPAEWTRSPAPPFLPFSLLRLRHCPRDHA